MPALPKEMDGHGMCRLLAMLEDACADGASERDIGVATKALVQEPWARGWLVVFDWPDWAHAEGKALMETPARLAQADLETVRKLLTAHIRQDRFVEGSLEASVRDGSLVPVMERLVECRREADPIGAWLDEHDCFMPLHVAWEEIQGNVELSSRDWARLKHRGFIGDQGCKWVIARVFRMYAMWRIGSPGAPALMLSREGAQRVRGWVNPRVEGLEGPALLRAFESVAMVASMSPGIDE